MEDVITQIKTYALLLSPDIDEDEDLFDFIVRDIVDRFLSYTNRRQLIVLYELALEEEEEPSEFPVPAELERVLAKIVVSTFNTITAESAGSNKDIKSLDDNGQKITYSDNKIGYYNSLSEQDVFSGSLEIIKKYILPTVVENPRRFQSRY